MFNGMEIPGDFLDLKPGNHILEIVLLKNGNMVKKEEHLFSVE
jgi:hypothetical protein